MARAQQTADAIHQRLPGLVRWDLEELEELSMEDLLYNPAVGPLVSTWTTEQRVAGLERVWVRLMAVWARVQLYAQNNGLERVVIVGHRYTTLLFLLHFLGLDWSAYPALDIAVEPGSVSRSRSTTPRRPHRNRQSKEE
jgi:broad specificity phosphatase PhoE